jgi:hypothetical protein
MANLINSNKVTIIIGEKPSRGNSLMPNLFLSIRATPRKTDAIETGARGGRVTFVKTLLLGRRGCVKGPAR